MSEDSEIKVTPLPEYDVVEWKVKDFSTLRDKNSPENLSPAFKTLGSEFRIWLGTVGASSSENENYISLQLFKIKGRPIPSSVICLMKVGDTWIAIKKCEKYQDWCNSYYKSTQFVKISELETSLEYNTSINSNSSKPAITAANRYSFTIVCLISQVDNIEQCDVSTQTANLNGSTSDVKKLSAGNKFSEDETANGSKKLSNVQGVQTLSNNFKELYLSKEHWDVKIKVGSNELSAHKLILSARSPVFASMFRHEMAENVNGTLDISDCEPKSFEVFLKFLYTGQMDGVCYSNAIGLYKTADKYSVDDLKEECVTRLCEGMEAENICDILDLAAVHEETKLLETAINFFIENVKDILVTAKWQVFKVEKSTLANECLKKMVEKKL